MNYFPRDTKLGQVLKTDAKGVTVEECYVAHMQISSSNATAGNNTGVLAATALTTTTQALTTGITNPGVPRNIRIVGNVAGITGNVVIKGTNYNNDSISETLALNGTTVVEGAKAFKTVTEVDLPIQTAAGNTVSVGVGEKLGFPFKLPYNTVRDAFLGGIKETVAATVTTSSTVLENNTIKLNSALNSSVVDVYFIV